MVTPVRMPVNQNVALLSNSVFYKLPVCRKIGALLVSWLLSLSGSQEKSTLQDSWCHHSGLPQRATHPGRINLPRLSSISGPPNTSARGLARVPQPRRKAVGQHSWMIRIRSWGPGPFGPPIPRRSWKPFHYPDLGILGENLWHKGTQKAKPETVNIKWARKNTLSLKEGYTSTSIMVALFRNGSLNARKRGPLLQNRFLKVVKYQETFHAPKKRTFWTFPIFANKFIKIGGVRKKFNETCWLVNTKWESHLPTAENAGTAAV